MCKALGSIPSTAKQNGGGRGRKNRGRRVWKEQGRRRIGEMFSKEAEIKGRKIPLKKFRVSRIDEFKCNSEIICKLDPLPPTQDLLGDVFANRGWEKVLFCCSKVREIYFPKFK
jgi:hypothetical protein